ncbi:MAG: AbrB/MazE/SpoVT family DNA-binding domain-containing protein [Nitrososphaerales archaeon]
MMQQKIYRVRLTSKGQLVIPKALREKYKLKEGSVLRVIAESERMILTTETGAPFTELRGLMRTEWKKRNLDGLVEEARRSLFKV